jgi:uncharacterized membrane protein
MSNFQEDPYGLAELFSKYPRRCGATFTILGVFMSYLGIILPIQQAEAGDTSIRLSVKSIYFAEALLMVGLPPLIFGFNCSKLLKKINPQTNQAGFYLTIAAIVVILCGTQFLVEWWLAIKGYKSR